jgi:hypothetical protein
VVAEIGVLSFLRRPMHTRTRVFSVCNSQRTFPDLWNGTATGGHAPVAPRAQAHPCASGREDPRRCAG